MNQIPKSNILTILAILGLMYYNNKRKYVKKMILDEIINAKYIEIV